MGLLVVQDFLSVVYLSRVCGIVWLCLTVAFLICRFWFNFGLKMSLKKKAASSARVSDAHEKSKWREGVSRSIMYSKWRNC